MRSPLILAAFLCSLLVSVNAGASSDTQNEKQDDVEKVKAAAGPTNDVYIPWTWDDVED